MRKPRHRTYKPASEEEPLLADTRTALYPAIMLSLGYAAFSVLYIFTSTFLAGILAEDLLHLARIELIKGIVFVIASSILLFVLVYKSLVRLISKEKQLYRQRMELNEAENRSTAGLFASSVAHDINNILMITKQAVEMLSETDLPESARGNIHSLENANQHLGQMANRLSQASGRHLSSGTHWIDAAETVRSAVDLVKTHSEVKRCNLETSLPETLPVLADSLALHRLVLNLIINAAEAVCAERNSGRIRIEMNLDKTNIKIAVHDNGPGIPAKHRKLVFEPFFSTKGSGTGLGLLSARLFAELHKGDYGIVESRLGGACVYVKFPAIVPNGASAEKPPSEVTTQAQNQ